ncbi:MAG: RHS repeat domain-containing protein [Bacteroidota bacterium]
MKQLRKYIKVVAAFLLVNTVYYIVGPTAAMALTAGPTAPEYSSFEPVDTSEMVNLSTGDLTYNIPLLEVPGPAGGYPLSLSYHAGISPGLEASWVGLGWTLNAGAVNRIVNGFADDYDEAEEVSRLFWEGGKTASFTYGVSVGFPSSPATIGLSRTIAYDTYKGFGVGHSLSVGTSVNGVGLGASLSQNPYGGFSLSGSAQSGIGPVRTSVGINVDKNGISGGQSTGISLKTGKSDKAPSISTSGILKTIANPKAGEISTKGFNIGGDIPVLPLVNLRLGASFQRYWQDNTVSQSTQGSLFFPDAFKPTSYYNDHEFDVYDELDLSTSLDHKNDLHSPLRSMRGSFADYDHYTVTGQGTGGVMRPYQYKNFLPRQFPEQKRFSHPAFFDRLYYPDGKKQYKFDENSYRPQFRFSGDFSNKLLNPGFGLSYNQSSVDRPIDADLSLDFNTGLVGDGISEGKLYGSSNIEWFSNTEIIQGVAERYGFIKANDSFELTRKLDNKIGGYMVTNESGVTYHYALPVYSYDEYTLSKNIEQEGDNFNQSTKKEPYAYTWLLTAVTGPDYMKRGDHHFDGDDFGYWVEFDYGQWTDKYGWRNPGTGSNMDIDNQFEVFSKGKKEIYYLDAIRTASHTAIFVKDLRKDAKGTTEFIEAGVETDDDKDRVKQFDEGGFIPKQLSGAGQYSLPMPSLKLSSILLFQNKDFNPDGGNPIFEKDSGTKILPAGTLLPNEDNVFTSADVSLADKQKAVKEIELSHDYRLMKGTYNSFSNDFYQLSNPSTDGRDYEKDGKLTLNSVKTKMKGGLSLIPPTTFEYELDNPLSGTGKMRVIDGSQDRLVIENSFEIPFNPGINPGDIIKYTINGTDFFAKAYLGFVNDIDPIAFPTYDIFVQQILQKSPRVGEYDIEWTITKNPNYSPNSTDIWGMFKDNYSDTKNYNVDRATTKLSAKNTDSWSLRKIVTELGSEIEINYEPDDYETKVLENKTNFIISDWSLNTNQDFSLTIESSDVDLKDLYQVGDLVDLSFAYERDINYSALCLTQDRSDYIGITEEAIVQSIPTSGTIVVSCDAIRNQFNTVDVRNEGICKITTTKKNFEAGNLSSTKRKFKSYGGDLRVASIKYSDPLTGIGNNSYYYYNDPSDPTSSSGVTSYEPNYLNAVNKDLSLDYQRALKREYFKELDRVIDYSRDLPSPGILYNYVTLKNSVTNSATGKEEFLPNKTVYEFRVFDEKMLQTNSDDLINRDEEYDREELWVNGEPGDGILVGTVVKKGIYAKKNTIRNMTSAIGVVKSVNNFAVKHDNSNAEVDTELLTRTVNSYLFDYIEDDQESIYFDKLEEFYHQGYLNESAVNAHYIVEPNSDDETKYIGLYATELSKEYYPNIALGTKSYNYVTGQYSETRNLAYDFYSGELTTTYSVDMYGNKYVSSRVPAYQLRKYLGGIAYEEMGLKSKNPSYKNMLTQEGASYTYKLDKDYDPDTNGFWRSSVESVMNASLQTWSNIGSNILSNEGAPDGLGLVNQYADGIYRRKASYDFIGTDGMNSDGSYNYTYIETDLASIDGNTNMLIDLPGWRKNGEAKLYDIHSHVLEAEDINGNLAATKFDNDFYRVYSSAANAGYGEYAYSGAEDQVSAEGLFGGSVGAEHGVPFVFDSQSGGSLKPHTGERVLKLSPNQKGFSFESGAAYYIPGRNIVPGRTYLATVWTTNPQQTIFRLSINGLASVDLEKSVQSVGDWSQIKVMFTLPENTETFKVFVRSDNEVIYLDDFMVRPVDANVTGYVYNKWGELSDIINANNLSTHYEYDEMGRLSSVWTESFQYGFQKVSDSKIKYAIQD